MFSAHFTEFDRLLNNDCSARFWAPIVSAEVYTSAHRQPSFRPRIDLLENKDTNTITAIFDLPGLKSEDIGIDIQQNDLTVSGEVVRSPDSGDSGYVVRERHLGKFSRTLKLPVGTKAEDVKAKMENGLLTISFPRVNPEQQPHRIPIVTA